MGRDKARLRLGRKTLLGQVKFSARQVGFPVRVIRRDLVPGRGPIGGVYTALKKTRAKIVVLLSCDMPFVSPELIQWLILKLRENAKALFTTQSGRVGFPFVIRTEALAEVQMSLRKRNPSLQRLAVALRAKKVRIPLNRNRELMNINTAEDWQRAKQVWHQR